MKTGDLIGVYGTLRQGETADLSLRGGAEFLGISKINGKMYQRGWYPGLKLLEKGNDYDPNKPQVTVEVYKITDAALPRHLDAYEGYPDLYDRQQVETDKSQLIWVYTYNYPVGENELIPSGDWLKQEVTE